jgi:hypothetical protein
MPHCRFSDLGEASGAHGTEWVAEGDRWPLGWLRQYVQDRLQTRRYQVAKQPPGRTSRRAIARWKTRVNALCPPGWSQPSASRSLWHDRGPPRSNFHDVKQHIRSRGAMRPSFARFSAPPRGADGAPRGAPGVGPHACRVAWGALARRRSNPAPRDDRLLALQPWRLLLPGSSRLLRSGICPDRSRARPSPGCLVGRCPGPPRRGYEPLRRGRHRLALPAGSSPETPLE